MTMSAPVIAGTLSTILFISAELPMVLKALRTRDLASYSLGNITFANAGNLIYSIYVYSLPPGPVWLMHGFYMATTALMLGMYLRYELAPSSAAKRRVAFLIAPHRDYPARIPRSGNDPAASRP